MHENLIIDFLKSRIECIGDSLIEIPNYIKKKEISFGHVNIKCEYIQNANHENGLYLALKYIDHMDQSVGFDKDKFPNLIEPLNELGMFDELFCFSVTCESEFNRFRIKLVQDCIHDILMNIGLSRIAMGGYEMHDGYARIIISMSHSVLTDERFANVFRYFKKRVQDDMIFMQRISLFKDDRYTDLEPFYRLTNFIMYPMSVEEYFKYDRGILLKYGDNFAELEEDVNFKNDIEYIVQNTIRNFYI